MRIKAMTATFGKLQKAHLELSPGMNILQAPNEGGKSTWCAFLRAMLYGIPTRERDSKGFLAEKNRYQPWSGAPMEGVVELEWQGRDITLRRGPRGNTPFGDFSATYTGTGESVPGLTAETCGEKLLGVSRAVFERTAFVGQGGAAIGESGELERRVAALVSSGEEEVSYSQAEARLRDWRNRRRSNVKNGLIPKLEGELTVINDTLARQERSRRQAGAAHRALKDLIARRDVLRDKLWAWRSKENVEKRRRWQEAQSALEAAQAEAAALAAQAAALPDREALTKAQGELSYLRTLDANRKLAESQVQPERARAEAAAQAARDPLFPDMTPEQAAAQAAADRERAAAVVRGPHPALWVLVCLLALAGAILLAAPLLWLALAEHRVLLLAGGGGALVLALAALICCLVLGRNAKKRGAASAALLERYGVDSPEGITARSDAYRERWTAAREAENAAEAVEREAVRLGEQQEALKASLLELVHSYAPEVKDVFGISAALSKALNLTERRSNAAVRLEAAEKLAAGLERPEELEGDAPQGEVEPVDVKALAAQIAALEGEISRHRSELAMAQGELNTLGDPDIFEARRGALTEELTRRREEYEALTLALDGLEAANTQLQARFSPALNEAAGTIFAALTGGKYGKVTLTREFEASAEEQSALLPRRALSLSQGTAEQLYLAVRLAICSLALDGETSLVLDDALDAFDDDRAALALEYLRLAAAERQLLLFTCHSREGAWAAGKPDVSVKPLAIGL